MRLQAPYSLALFIVIPFVAAACSEPGSESRTCTTTVALRDEISSELSEVEEVQSTVTDAASQLEDMIARIQRRGDSELEEVREALENVAGKLEEVRDALSAKEIPVECEVK